MVATHGRTGWRAQRGSGITNPSPCGLSGGQVSSAERTDMKRPLSTFTALSILVATAVAGDVRIELTGTVCSNSYSSGPFAGASPGDVAVLTYEVITPGTDVVAGQLTNYDIDLSTFDLDINGSTGAALAGPSTLQIQNDFPAADGFRINASPLATGEFFSSGFGTGGGFFSSTDLSLLLGMYDAAANLTSFDYVIQGQGGMMEIFPETLVIGLPSLGTNYCVATVNSSGLAAQMSAVGSDVAADQDLTLVTDGVVPGVPGLYFFGPNAIQVPFGNGFRCVGGSTSRVQPAAFADAQGRATRVLDFNAPYGGTITSGACLHFQLWYRDSMAGAGFNLSDGLKIQFN